MSIHKIDNSFQKGLAIIVSNKPDGILVHAAKVLGNEIQFLDIANINLHDKYIYLIGHGNKKNRTIDGKAMEEIAQLLIESGYRGEQKLYVTACGFKTIYHGTSMYSLLCYYLSKNRIRVDNIISDIDGNSIIIENNGEPQLWVVKNDTKIICKSVWQKIVTKTDVNKVRVEMFSDLEMLKRVQTFKLGLIRSFGGDIMTVPDCLWRPYMFFCGGIFGGVILGFFGLLRTAGISINDMELILGAIGCLFIPVDIWLIKEDKSFQNTISFIVGGFLLSGIIYLLIRSLGGFAEAIIGLFIIVLELFIFLVKK